MVPPTPGPLIWPRRRDELDEFIDDLLPDVEHGPGWFDAALVGGGMAAIAWGFVGGPPPVTFAGVGPVALGLLPLRSAWRMVARRRRASGMAVPYWSPTETWRGSSRRTKRWTGRRKGAPPPMARSSRSPPCSKGRSPVSDREREYVGRRAAAIDGLAHALQAPDDATDALVEAREELDAIGGVSALRGWNNFTAEARMRGGPGGATSGA